MASLIETEIKNNKQDFLKKDIDFYSVPNHLKPTLPTTEGTKCNKSICFVELMFNDILFEKKIDYND